MSGVDRKQYFRSIDTDPGEGYTQCCEVMVIKRILEEERLNKGRRCYHTQRLPGGITLHGEYDHERFLTSYGLPYDLSGQRVLDLGTADGFFAFLFEQRGAAEVVAVDRRHSDAFALAHNALDSKVVFVASDLFDLCSHDMGHFDLVFCGSVLLHLIDPYGALRVISSLTRHTFIIATAVYPSWGLGRFLNLLLSRQPVAHFVDLGKGTVDATYWLPNEACLKKMILSAGFRSIELAGRFNLTSEPGRSDFNTPHLVLRAGKPAV